MAHLPAIAIAVEILNGPSALSGILNISPASVSQWVSGFRRVPAERCPDIERAVVGAVTCEQLRPDIRWHRVEDKAWPHPTGRPLIDVAAAGA